MDEIELASIANDVWFGCKLWLYYLDKGYEIDDRVLKRFNRAEELVKVIDVSEDVIKRLKSGKADRKEIEDVMKKADRYATKTLFEAHATWLEYLRLLRRADT